MPRFSIPTFVLAAVTLLLAGGCGGSGAHHGNGGGGGGGTAGAYSGTVDFPNGNTGTVILEVEEGGAASGHVLVTSPPAQLMGTPGSNGFPEGFFSILGSASGGVIDMDGFANNENFTVSGTLPEGNGTGSITLTLGGNDFTGTIAKDTSAAPGGSVTYSEGSTSNAHTVGFPDGDTSFTLDSGGGFIDLFFSDNTGTTGRSISFNLPSDVQAGDSFTCSPDHHVVSYNEHPEGTFFPNVWAAVSGTVTVTARSGSHITLTLADVAMEHQTSIGEATGSFVLNGELHS